MRVLTLRTDKPKAEVGLYDDHKRVAYKAWQAHRQLAETLHSKIAGILESSRLDWSEIDAVLVYKGPGSFTGLRIGVSVASSLSLGLGAKLLGSSGDNWLEQGLTKLQAGHFEDIVVIEYGAPVHITKQKK